MALPLGTMGALSAGLSAAGKIFGNKQPSTSTRQKTMEGMNFWQNYNQQERQHWKAIESQDIQNAVAQNSLYKMIQTRVKDANAAGIHPLYALGAPGNSQTQAVFPGQGQAPQGQPSQSGSMAGDALSGIGDVLGSLHQSKVNNASRLQSTALNAQTLAESRARTKLLESQAGAVALNAKSSAISRAAQASNAKQDTVQELVSTMGSVPGLPTNSQAETWERHFGSLVGEPVGFSHLLNQVGKKVGKSLYKTHKEYNRNFTDPYIGGP